jgi:oxaloacetate decarboxylase (Na+ extruding) subunit gamma
MSDLMMEGFNLALFGMGFVFIFLILLVFLTTLMTVVIRKYVPMAPTPVKARGSAKKHAGRKSDDGEQTRIVAAISAAIRQHRSGAD